MNNYFVSKTIKFIFFIHLTPLFLFGEEGRGNNIGPLISVYNNEELKWENSSMDYFVMFKSLIKEGDTTTSNYVKNRCLTESEIMDMSNGIGFYTLESSMIPEDAYIIKAFLVWMSSIPDSDKDKNTDNQVKLTFYNTKKISDQILMNSDNITAPEAYLPGINRGFEYESIVDRFEPNYPLLYYTYRVDITDFFESIQKKGRGIGFETNRDAITGYYFLSDLTCVADEENVINGTFVSNWAIFVVYTSEKIKPKNIYFYNGLNTYYNYTSQIPVSGFKLPENSTVRVSLMTAEGEPGNYNSELPFKERFTFTGDSTLGKFELTNKCNPQITGDYNYTEIYNSISSSYNWQGTELTCIGGEPANPEADKLELGIDIDTFILTSDEYPGHLTPDRSSMNFEISANQDMIVTNMMVLSVDTKPHDFDIPDEPESIIYSCSELSNKICDDRPFYFYIKVQNWGKETANNIVIKDELQNNYKYVPGTTSIIYRINQGEDHVCWRTIEDKANQTKFPLADEGYTLPFSMDPCNEINENSCDTAYIRFKVDRPDEVNYWSIDEKITNRATITVPNKRVYLTNSGIPLKATIDRNCPPISSCTEPDINSYISAPECRECETDEDCPDNYACDNYVCIPRTCKDTDIIPDEDTDTTIPPKNTGCECNIISF